MTARKMASPAGGGPEVSLVFIVLRAMDHTSVQLNGSKAPASTSRWNASRSFLTGTDSGVGWVLFGDDRQIISISASKGVRQELEQCAPEAPVSVIEETRIIAAENEETNMSAAAARMLSLGDRRFVNETFLHHLADRPPTPSVSMHHYDSLDHHRVFTPEFLAGHHAGERASMSMNLATTQVNELLYVGFNQDYGCFACGTDTGFVIYTCDPFKETFRRDFNTGGIGIVEMLFRCNILALVGGGRSPRYPSNKVMIWDDHQNRCIGELTFRSEVRAVKLRRDRVVVVLEYKIYVYNFSDLKLVDHIETIANPRGLQRGHVRVELYDIRKTTLIPAHETALSCLALNNDGTRVATSSEKGTLIRVYDTQSGMQLHELRRGADRADIYSICYNYNSQFLAVASDRGTVHIFSLTQGGGGAGPAPDDAGAGQVFDGKDGMKRAASDSNARSSLSFMKGILPRYFSSEWSFAQYRLPERQTVCAFGVEKNSLVAIQSDGTFYKAKFDPVSGGEAKEEMQQVFVDRKEEQ